jgi:hypothetical protein
MPEDAYPLEHAIDVTESVLSALDAGRSTISFGFVRAVEDGTEAEAQLYSREAGEELAPRLVAVSRDAPVEDAGVDADVDAGWDADPDFIEDASADASSDALLDSDQDLLEDAMAPDSGEIDADARHPVGPAFGSGCGCRAADASCARWPRIWSRLLYDHFLTGRCT